MTDITGIHPIKAFLTVKHLPYSLLLDSADPNHPESRYSFVMCKPIETIEAFGNNVSVTNWEQRLSITANPLDVLEDRLAVWIPNAETVPDLPPFQGGAAGLFGYDLGRTLEKLPENTNDGSKTPDMAVGIYDQVLAYDHKLKKTYLFTHAENDLEAKRKQDFLINLVTQEYKYQPHQGQQLDWYGNFDEEGYIGQVQRVIDYIYAGDIFQANLSQRFDAKLPQNFDPFIHYMHMREINPAPFSTFMNLGNIKISSASPERFVTMRGGQVITCPIKGTRPRVADVVKDMELKKELINSEKDRAENIMIVDLMRNDLSRVCDAHSIQVPDLCRLETFATVHHLVSTVTGMLSENNTTVDIMRSCFPGGSITGAPKIRAMEIIEELEPTRRNAYCGSIGYIGFDGTMDSNILIRTLTFENGRVSFQVGSGIVADSDPREEYQETLDKAEATFRSFETSALPQKAFSKAV